jgi:hypothetical protein
MTSFIDHAATARIEWVDHHGEKQSMPLKQAIEEVRNLVNAVRAPATNSSDQNYQALSAAYGFVSSIVPRADRKVGESPMWYGWAVREGFMAGFHYANATAAMANQASNLSVTVDKTEVYRDVEASEA